MYCIHIIASVVVELSCIRHFIPRYYTVHDGDLQRKVDLLCTLAGARRTTVPHVQTLLCDSGVATACVQPLLKHDFRLYVDNILRPYRLELWYFKREDVANLAMRYAQRKKISLDAVLCVNSVSQATDCDDPLRRNIQNLFFIVLVVYLRWTWQ